MKGLNTSEDAGSLQNVPRTFVPRVSSWDMDNDAFEKIAAHPELFRRACNLLVDIIREDTEKKLRLWQRFNLHHAGYYRVREAVPELGAQLVCNAVRAVSAGLQDPAVQQSEIRKGQESGVAKIVFKTLASIWTCVL